MKHEKKFMMWEKSAYKPKWAFRNMSRFSYAQQSMKKCIKPTTSSTKHEQVDPGLEVMKHFSCSNSTEDQIYHAHKC